MENGSIVLVILVGGYLGRKAIVHGLVGGTVISIVCYFLFESNSSMTFIEELFLGNFVKELILGFLVSLATSTMVHLILSGLRGGDHNKSPYYLGGGDDHSGHGGIIYTDEDIKAKKDNERKIP